MSRIPLVEPEHASPEVRAIYSEIEKSGLPVYNVMKLFANNQHFLGGLLNFVNGLYSSNSRLDPRLRELAYLRASQANACHY
ncbi:MAG: carboxymuconolactone decarboxylase family protein [Candidatus Binataceae bacterium]